MPHGQPLAWPLLAALGSGLMAGVFFAFSAMVMKALARLPPAEGIRAMQSINVVALTPAFMTVFFGTAVVSVVAAVFALRAWEAPSARYVLLGSVLYVFGVVVVTAAFNVPRNSALAAVDPAHVDAAAQWTRYVSGWTAWNHVRMVAALGALVSFLFGLRV
ncbi:DUF1772 domain-containing protein [Pyxidicoccus fallax]|uniref:DUF1772 domain-containing protein n=1 Tax=Pyxidicoccus fallax TaxID=394095 RepID=A0A848L4T5_9BACT|nr:anthrone oxygenase family protein [Pyxidicoccus fallax]NMO13679.1 DUF1772 domain-containing protein [Pyxidicoccus fallax]NPC76833.1 DUF1772 domain-containing protein [Pyxidicoccus fallax]